MGGVPGSPGPDHYVLLELPSGEALPGSGPPGSRAHGSYLVDSASSHMLVSKIKPCMSKYKQSIR